MNKWDKHFHNLCIEISKQSSCLSRQIGAILVRDNIIISTGYNGPPRGVPHCKFDFLNRIEDSMKVVDNPKCPRQILGYKSGEYLDICPSVHAETNCLASAARVGAITKDTTLYMNCIIPCKSCFGLLINAGVKEIVVESLEGYDSLAKDFILPHSEVVVRTFET